MIVNTLVFLFENIGWILISLILLVIVYSWITLFIKKDHEFITDLNKKYKDTKFTIKDLISIKYQIKHMEGREFEIFCEWFFNKIDKYKSVTLTPAVNDEGKDLILVDENNISTFVECKRYTDKATVTEEFMIGREVCQKLVGAMAADNIENGLIVTTGSVHQNAWDYINKLEKNTNIKIEVMNLDDIMKVIEEINNTEVLDIVGLEY